MKKIGDNSSDERDRLVRDHFIEHIWLLLGKSHCSFRYLFGIYGNMIYIVVGIAYTQRVHSNLVKLRVTRTACECSFQPIYCIDRCFWKFLRSATPTPLKTEVLLHHLPATNWPNKTDLGWVSWVSCLVPPTWVRSQSCSAPPLSLSLCLSIRSLSFKFRLVFGSICIAIWLLLFEFMGSIKYICDAYTKTIRLRFLMFQSFNFNSWIPFRFLMWLIFHF